MTRLTDDRLRELRALYDEHEEMHSVFDELLALRAERDLLTASLKKQDAEIARLKAEIPAPVAVAAIVRELEAQAHETERGYAYEAAGRLRRVADDIETNWRAWVAKEPSNV